MYIHTNIHTFINTNIHKYINTNIHNFINTCIHKCMQASIQPVKQPESSQARLCAAAVSFTTDCCCSAVRVMSLTEEAANKQPSCFCLQHLRYFCMACSRGSKWFVKTSGNSPAASAETRGRRRLEERTQDRK